MFKAMARDEFSKPIKSLVGERASFHCSRCKLSTLSAALNNENKASKIGIVAHITAASELGPRFDEAISTDERISASNAIYLCENCASLIDKNDGVDFTVSEIKAWKEEHEEWTRTKLPSLHKSIELELLDLSVHLGSNEFPAVDIKILNGSSETTYFTKGRVTTIDRFIIPGDRHANYRPISWKYVVDVSPEVGGTVDFEMSQEVSPNEAERFALEIKGEFPHYGDPVALNLYQLKIELFQGESLKLTLPDVIVHIPRDGKVLALTRPPCSKESYLEFLSAMANKSRSVLDRLQQSIDDGTKLCCDHEVVDALIMFSNADRNV